MIKRVTQRFLFCTNGQYTVIMNEKEFILNPGDEIVIPRGTEQWGKCICRNNNYPCIWRKTYSQVNRAMLVSADG